MQQQIDWWRGECEEKIRPSSRRSRRKATGEVRAESGVVGCTACLCVFSACFAALTSNALVVVLSFLVQQACARRLARQRACVKATEQLTARSDQHSDRAPGLSHSSSTAPALLLPHKPVRTKVRFGGGWLRRRNRELELCLLAANLSQLQ